MIVYSNLLPASVRRGPQEASQLFRFCLLNMFEIFKGNKSAMGRLLQLITGICRYLERLCDHNDFPLRVSDLQYQAGKSMKFPGAITYRNGGAKPGLIDAAPKPGYRFPAMEIQQDR